MKYLLIMIIFISCSKHNDFLFKKNKSVHKHNSTFNVYINFFIQKAKSFNRKIHVKTIFYFDKLKHPNAGICYYSNNYQNTEIAIDRLFWKNASELQRQQLIDHELGHCILKREKHNDKTFEECPESIMRSWAFNEDEIDNCLIPYSDEYYKELFKKK